MNMTTTTWRRVATMGLATCVALLVLGGCDYLNPLAGSEQSGASGDLTGKSGAEQKQQQSDDGEGEESKESANNETGGPDVGTDAGDPTTELAVPEPSDDASSGPTRNPFEPKVPTGEQEDDGEPERQGPRDPLERYALDQLKLSAVISGIAVPKAMFIAPDEMGHLVQEGDRIGTDGAEIVDIRSNAVELSIPQGPEEPAVTQTIELEERGVGTSRRAGGEMTQEQQQMLERLMESEEGREAIRERYQGSSSNGDDSTGLRPPGARQRQGNQNE